MKKYSEKNVELYILQIKALPLLKDIKICSELNMDNSALFSQHNEDIENKQQFVGPKNLEDFDEMIDSLEISQKNKLLDIYLYTDKNVFFAELAPSNLNKQLNWIHNKKFTESLRDCLSGKNKNVVVNFVEDVYPKLVLSCDYEESGIRIMFFEVEMVCLEKPPLQHAKNVLKSHSKRCIRRIQDLETQESKLTQQIDKCQYLYAEIKDSHESEMNHIQNSFLPLVNRIKEKSRIFFRENHEIQYRQVQRQEEQSTQSRKFEQKLQKASSSNDHRDSENFQKLFRK